MIHQVNLLPDIKQQRLREQRMRRLFSSAAITIIVVAAGIPLILFGIKGGQGLYLKRVQNNIDERKQTIRKTADISTILTVKDHLNSLPDLFSRRVVTTELLAYLPAVTPNEIRLTNLSIDSSGTIRISGVSPSYAAVEKFQRALLNAGEEIDPNKVEPDPNSGGYFTNLNVESVSGPSGSEVSFAITATFSNSLVDGAPNG